MRQNRLQTELYSLKGNILDKCLYGNVRDFLYIIKKGIIKLKTSGGNRYDKINNRSRNYLSCKSTTSKPTGYNQYFNRCDKNDAKNPNIQGRTLDSSNFSDIKYKKVHVTQNLWVVTVRQINENSMYQQIHMVKRYRI